MLKKKHVVLHTSADVDQAHGLLERQTVKGSAMPDHPLEVLKDTVRLDDKPFRGEIGATDFKLTRRRRGDKTLRVKLEGKLKPKPQGGTEIHATMSAPKTLIAGLVAGLAAVGIIGSGVAMGDMPLWAGAFFLGGEALALGLASWMYERETSRTFSALRDAIPENPPQAVAPVSSVEEAAPNLAERSGVKQG